MIFVFDMVALAGGLVLGGVGGYAIGTKWRDDHRLLWPIAISAFVLASVFNFVGRWLGMEWLSIGSIGLMAGITTGVKYGGFPDVRVWEKKPPRPSAGAEQDGEETPAGQALEPGEQPETSGPTDGPAPAELPARVDEGDGPVQTEAPAQLGGAEVRTPPHPRIR